jgi:hypothetical protein
MTDAYTGKTVRLAKADSIYNYVPNVVPGLIDSAGNNKIPRYHESLRYCWYFYRADAIANTVTNRIAEITATQLRNRRRSYVGGGSITDEEFEVFNAAAKRLQKYLETIILSYLINGMAIPQYEVVRTMGSRLSSRLGRTRYFMPDMVWCRNPVTITLKRGFNGTTRRAFLKIPQEDIVLAKTGKMPDGTSDPAYYDNLINAFPDYVNAIKSGMTEWPVHDYIIYRKLLPMFDYPIPYLEPAIKAFEYKQRLKEMDLAIASRAIESFRHISVGSDAYPADEDDINAAKAAMNQTSSIERVYNLYTNHTIKVSWVTPPMDALLDDRKYGQANADIFFALGFPRILTVGETEKSNSADNKIAALGILSTLRSIQRDILEWIKTVYERVADLNGFTRIPEPYLSPIQLADVTQLIQYARDMIELNVISRDTAAAFYGSDHETEIDQILYERDSIDSLAPAAVPETELPLSEDDAPPIDESVENDN